MLGLVEDERTFSTLSFMKSRLKNHLNEHLHIVVGTPSRMMLALMIRRIKNLRSFELNSNDNILSWVMSQ